MVRNWIATIGKHGLLEFFRHDERRPRHFFCGHRLSFHGKCSNMRNYLQSGIPYHQRSPMIRTTGTVNPIQDV